MNPYFSEKLLADAKLCVETTLQEELSSPTPGLQKFASSQLAAPDVGALPMSNREETLLSYAVLEGHIEKLAACGVDVQTARSRLETALVAFDAIEESRALRESFLPKEAHSKHTSSHELDSELGYLLGGSSFSGMTSKTPDEILKEAASLEKSLSGLSPKDSRLASLNLLKQAATAGVDTEEFSTIEAYGGLRGTDIEKAAELMAFRAKRTNDPMLKKAMARLAQTIIIMPEHEVDLEKVAQFIDDFDSVVGTDRLVRRGTIPDGFNTVFNKDLIEKAAGVDLAGKEFTEEQLRSLPVTKWAAALGEEFVKSATSNGEFDYAQAIDIASTLPLPEAKSLSLYLEGN